MNTKVIVLIVVLLVVLVGLLWWLPIAPKAPSGTESVQRQEEDTTTVINQELESVNLDELDADFMDVDKNLQSL